MNGCRCKKMAGRRSGQRSALVRSDEDDYRGCRGAGRGGATDKRCLRKFRSRRVRVHAPRLFATAVCFCAHARIRRDKLNAVAVTRRRRPTRQTGRLTHPIASACLVASCSSPANIAAHASMWWLCKP